MPNLRSNNVASWVNYCPSETDEAANETPLSYWGMLEPPEIPDLDGDIEHEIRTGERLESLAYRYYNDAMLWWVIAVRNGMDLPDVETTPGKQVTVPDPAWVQANIVRR